MKNKISALLLSLLMAFSFVQMAYAQENTIEKAIVDPSEIQQIAENDKIFDYQNLNEISSKIKPEYKEYYSNLSYQDKQAELISISKKYKAEGDILSERDSAIIILNCIESRASASLRSGYSDEWYDVYKTKYGVKVNLYGRMRQDIAYIAGSSRFGGTATVNVMSGSVKNVNISIYHTAYGLVGTSAPYVGVLYNGSVSVNKSGNNKYTKMDKDSEYGSILPTYTTMYASGTITNSSGDEFTVTSDTWTRWQ